MILIAILLALGTERFWKSVGFLSQFEILIRYAVWLQQRCKDQAWFNGSTGVLLVVAPVVVVVGIVQHVIGSAPGVLAWLLSLIFSVAILIFCIGVKDINQHVNDYLNAWNQDDPEAAYLYVKDLLGGEMAENPRQLHLKFLEFILIRINERLLAILFWFVVLGPVGAVLYRAVSQLKGLARDEYNTHEDFMEGALRFKAILDWLPVRITALCYAIIGNFVEAVHCWGQQIAKHGNDWVASNNSVLVSAGCGALQLADIFTEDDLELDSEDVRDQILAAEALVRRTVVAWLTFLAILTVVGWMV